MSIELDLQRLGGIATTRALGELGHSAAMLRNAAAAGIVTRPRRGWVAITGIDPALLFAVAHGVVLTCVTQAKRMGLWVLKDSDIHVAIPGRGDHPELKQGVAHWSRPLVPRNPSALIDPIENVLGYVAACQPFESALTIWDSARRKGLIDVERLQILPLRPAARKLLSESTPYADSGLETIFRARLRWLKVELRTQIWLCGHRVDFLLGSRLVVQIDGGTHVGAQRDIDNRHDAELRLRGYHVLRFSYVQIMNEWPRVQEIIQSAIALGLHSEPRSRAR